MLIEKKAGGGIFGNGMRRDLKIGASGGFIFSLYRSFWLICYLFISARGFLNFKSKGVIYCS